MRSVIINLDHRPDRLESAYKQTKKLLPYMPPVRFGAYSHMACLKSGYELIFEDDVEIINPDLFQIARVELPTNYDLMYLGGNILEPLNRYSEHLYKLTACFGTFAILYSKKGAKYVIENYDPMRDDVYDLWLRNRMDILNCYMCAPMITTTIKSYSDVLNQDVDYRKEMADNAERFMI